MKLPKITEFAEVVFFRKLFFRYGAFISVRMRAGIRIFCTEQRSQGQNRERAMQILRARLFEMELEKQRAAEAARRKSQVIHVY